LSSLSRFLEQTGQNWIRCLILALFGIAVRFPAGRIYLEQNRLAEAEVALRRASWLDIHDAESLNLIPAINIRQNRFDIQLAPGPTRGCGVA
jgi:hypothetical protein